VKAVGHDLVELTVLWKGNQWQKRLVRNLKISNYASTSGHFSHVLRSYLNSNAQVTNRTTGSGRAAEAGDRGTV
jgi:hypothetical protein